VRTSGQQRLGDPVRPVTELSAEDWSFTIRHELDIVFFVTRACGCTYRTGRGLVVNIASITHPGRTMPQNARRGQGRRTG
jgi:NAD(P)-dependent dehydrogenase (short-subunit alcohol dehydrogenase family)